MGGVFVCMGVGQGYVFYGDVYDCVEVIDGGECGGVVGCVVVQVNEQFVFEYVCVVGDQVDWNVDLGVYIVDYLL